jgi:hypothetical protein
VLVGESYGCITDVAVFGDAAGGEYVGGIVGVNNGILKKSFALCVKITETRSFYSIMEIALAITKNPPQI